MPAPKGHAPYPGCEKGGRPRIWTDEIIEKEAEELLEWLKKPGNFYFDDFCIEKGYPTEYLPQWANRNDKFRKAYKMARTVQKRTIAKNAMFKKFDSSFSKWFLSCNYGMMEGNDTSGLDEESQSKSTRSIADVKATCIEHANSLEQASGKPGTGERKV